jgi:hypothetical protein
VSSWTISELSGLSLSRICAGGFLYQTDPPDRDYVNVAVGAPILFPGGVTGFANFRELVGYRDRSSHAVTLGLRFAF